jgi:outer membrane protein W
VYRVAKLGPVTPIAGAGVMVLMGRNAKITNAVLQEAGDPKLSIKPSPGLVVQGGLDIQLWKRVAARVDVKYVLGMKVNATIEDIAVTPTAIPTLGSIEVGDAVMSAKVAPLIVQAGVGVDF